MLTNIRQYHHEIADTAWLFVLQGLNLLVPLFVWPYLMRVLGAEQFGIFGFAHSLANYACLVVDFGFNLSATKRVVLAKNNPDELNRIFSATMVAKLLLLIVAFILYASVLCVPQYHTYRPMALLMFISVIGSTFFMIWIFQGMGKISLVSTVNAISKLVFLPLIFVLVKSSDDCWIAILLHGITYIGTSLCIMIILWRLKWVKMIKVTRRDVIGEMRLSWPIFLSQAATSVYTALFVVVLAYYVSPQEVGWYSSAEKVMRVMVSVIMMPISGAFYPKISELSVSNRAEAKRFIKLIIIFLITVFAIGGIVLCLSADFIVSWLGNDYAGMQPLLYMVAFLPIPITIGGVCGQFGLLALGNEHSKLIYSRVYYCAAIWALVSVFIFSKTMGVQGTMISLISTELIVCTSMIICYIKDKKQKT